MNLSPIRIVAMFVVGYGATTLLSYKHQSFVKANEDVSNIVNKRQFLLDIDDKIAEKYDEMHEKDEVSRKFIKQRKILMSYAEGKVLETGVGTAKNLKFYKMKQIDELVGVDWSIKMIEEALAKDDENIMKFKLVDVE